MYLDDNMENGEDDKENGEEDKENDENQVTDLWRDALDPSFCLW